MRQALGLVLLFCAHNLSAQQPLEVRRGDLQVRVNLEGTVVVDDIIRLRAAVDGRVEDLNISTGSWFPPGQTLGHLANKEMAAILDSHNTTEPGVMEDRWRKVYEPTPISCPSDCYVLRVFIKNKEWLKPKALLFEAAQKITMVGRVRPEDVGWIKDGMDFQYWRADDPSKKYKSRIAGFVLDIQGEKAEPGGSFTLKMSPSHYFEPDTRWEGVIVPLVKPNVLVVPTGAIIDYNGTAYLPIKVSTGMTTRELTEITAGVQEKQDILVLDDAALKGAMRHQLQYSDTQPHAAADVEKKVQQDYLKPEKEPKPKKLKSLPDPDATYGDDPYAQ
jgi:hypothetical protein